MTDHPLTETAAAELWSTASGLPWIGLPALHRPGTVVALRAAFDAGREHERAEDDRPWMPLGQDDPLNAGDEMRQDHLGITTTAVVARVDEEGDPWTAEHALIGLRRYGTWHVRRAAPTLPTESGAVIVPADGHEFIEARRDGLTFHAREAMLTYGQWRAAWRTSAVGWVGTVTPKHITPDTWKVARND